MNAHIVELESSLHQKVAKLLPWMANGQLADGERAVVEQHLANCAECRADLAWQQKMMALQPAAGAAPDMEAALGRLLPQLTPPAPKKRWFGALFDAGRWMPYAMAAQVLVIGGLGLALLQQPAQFRLLSAAGAPAPANALVVFKPDTSERQLRALLAAQGAQVVGGPTVTHAWLLNVAPARLDAALAAMRADGAVSLAEPLVTGAPK